MDRITKSLFEDFVGSQNLEHLEECDAFARFGTFSILSKELQDSFELEDVETGGGGDLGIDSLAIVVNGRLVLTADDVDDLVAKNRFLDAEFILVQAKMGKTFNGADIGNFMFGAKDFFAEKGKLPRNQYIAECEEIQKHIYKRSADMTRGKPRLKLYYVTTGRWTDDVALRGRIGADTADLEATGLFRTVEFAPIDADALQALYRRTKSKTEAEFNFATRVVIPEIQDVEQAYLGLLPASEFLKLIRDDTGNIRKQIFYDNVRDFQDYNEVNLDMSNTINSPLKYKFALLNNGVTIIAKTVNPVGNKFLITDYQIVNGCQTSHVLFDNASQLDESVLVPVRLIATSDDAVTNAIIRATNRQTEVKPDQLYALSDFQKKLESFYASFPQDHRLHYERRSKQYAGESDIEKVRVVSIQQQMRVFASMFLQEAHKGHYGRALSPLVGTKIFAKNHQLEPYYASAFAYYKLESFFRRKMLDGQFKPARYHLLLLFRHRWSDEKLPEMTANAMKRYCEKLFTVLWDEAKALKVFTGAATLLRDVAGKRSIERAMTKTEPFTKEVLKRITSS